MKILYIIFGLVYINLASGQTFNPDTSVNEIGLLDSNSIRVKFKEDTSKINVLFALNDSVTPEIEVKNKIGEQTLTMVFHPGSATYQFSIFKVRHNDKATDKRLTIKLQDKELMTENGIKLGINKGYLLKTFGKPTITKNEKGLEIIEYRLTDKDSEILRKYRAAEYFATYTFKADKLIEFHFGFEYP